MKVAISMPEDLLERIDAAAERGRLQRSRWLQIAARRLLEEEQAELVREGVRQFTERHGDVPIVNEEMRDHRRRRTAEWYGDDLW